jgi:hypothetical protein
VENAKYFTYSRSGSDEADGPAGVSFWRSRPRGFCNWISGIGRAVLASRERSPYEMDIHMPVRGPRRQYSRHRNDKVDGSQADALTAEPGRGLGCCYAQPRSMEPGGRTGGPFFRTNARARGGWLRARPNDLRGDRIIRAQEPMWRQGWVYLVRHGTKVGR